jgi:Ala-tRNA(Pro) deacylase
MDISTQQSICTQKQKVIDLLNNENIEYKLIEHEAMYTIDQMVQAGLTDGYAICKNLFLRDYKGLNHYLVILLENKKADLKALALKLGSSRLSFASENRLNQYLKLKKGAVSPFGIINDSFHEVTLVIDKDLKQQEKVGFHPNDNTATVILSYEDFNKIIGKFENEKIYF